LTWLGTVARYATPGMFDVAKQDIYASISARLVRMDIDIGAKRMKKPIPISHPSAVGIDQQD